MIEVLIENHNHQHDLFELIRVFFPDRELVFVEDNLNRDKGLFIHSSLSKRFDKYLAICKIYSRGSLIKEVLVDIDEIKIKGFSKEKIIKNAIKKSIYDSLLNLIDFQVPWGILTGIRPTKLVHDLMDKHILEEDIEDILTNDFRLHKSKVELLLNITNLQKKYLYPLDEDKYSIYIGIPFCPSKCSYCSFPSYAMGNDYTRVEKYIDTLIYEIKSTKELMEGKWLNTVYIGGGTPTSIKTKDLERIVATVKDVFKDEDIREFTVEAGRPDTINTEKLKMLKDMEIDRISINPQTMNLKTLSKIGRNHNIESILSSYSLAKEIGFDIINMDLILGLPGEDIEDIAYSLNEIKKLDPDNLTVHTLSIKRRAELFNDKENIFNKTAMMKKALELTETKVYEMGLIPYYLYRQKQILGNLENIGYSKVGKECIYNISMMEEKETIIGLGLGAVSKFYYENKIERLPNFKDLIQYSNRIDELITKKRRFISK